MFSKKKTQDNETTANPAHQAADGTPAAPVEVAAAAAAGEPAAPQSAPEAPAASDEPSQEAKELLLMKDRYARLMADFDNFRKRQTREREDLIKRANEDLLGDLLPVVDHLELALAQAADRESPFVVGVKLVYGQFLALLDRYGMKSFEAKGEPFDTAYHEALSQMSSATVPANSVIDQFRRGWLLGGRLLRPAQVIVSSGVPDAQTVEAESQSVSD
jgi:molecular chaperone GrpE